MLSHVKKIFLITIVCTLASCGGSSLLMRPSATQILSPANHNQAKVVFMRTSRILKAINAELFDIVNGEPKFIASIPSGNKVVYSVSPGKKVFMAYGNAADFMTANLAPGKTYYVIVRPNWGTGGFAPTPIRNGGTSEYNTNSSDFKSWFKGTTLVETDTQQAQKWFATEKANIVANYKTYWARYQNKTPNEKAERHLNPQDGT